MDAPDRAVPPDTGPLVETTERRCPSCRSELVAPIGRLTAVFGIIKSTYECEACARRFIFVRPSPLDG
jgi:hypothetical protein